MLSRFRTFGLIKGYFARTSKKVFKSPSFQPEQEIEEDFEEPIKKQIDPASIIKKFRKDVLSQSLYSKQEEQMTRIIQQYDKNLKQTLKKGTKNQQLTNTRKLVEKFVNQKSIFGHLSKDPLISNYGNYSAYQAATITQQKIRRESYEGQRITKGYSFLKSLGPQYLENQTIDQHLIEAYEGRASVQQYAKHLQGAVNDANYLVQQAIFSKNNTDNDFVKEKSDSAYQGTEPQRDDHQIGPLFNDDGQQQAAFWRGPNNFGRLSPIACQQIYKCHLDGWSVKDISQRFGIHPRRTKFIIWARATYYIQVLPKLGFGHFKDMMLLELQYGGNSGFIDYGLDLDCIKSQNSNFVKKITSWNNNMIDIKADTDAERYRKRQEAIKQLQRHGQATPRHQKVLLGYFGKNNKLTQMRDWKIARAKGSDYQHAKYNTFRTLFKKTGRQTYK